MSGVKFSWCEWSNFRSQNPSNFSLVRPDFLPDGQRVIISRQWSWIARVRLSLAVSCGSARVKAGDDEWREPSE
jgi:hypothetical protein